MTNEKQLIARGADCVAGHLILRRKSMGTYLNGDFIISSDGLDELAVEDVVVREVKAPAKTPTKGVKLGAPSTPSAADELSELLGE